jgi:hypothetical protein
MKYISTMRNLYFLIITLFSGLFANAQNTSNSPFSSFGLGEVGGMDHAIFSSLGNTNITLSDSTVLNFYNPSSYSTIGKGQPIFSLGVSSRLSTFSENGVEKQSNITGVQHFAIGFSFAKRFGLAFGLKPYSRRGYDFNTSTAINGDSLLHFYSGTGGVNEVFLGLSATVLDYKGAKLSIGGNLGYLFGKVTNTRKSGLVASGSTVYNGGVNQQELKVNSFHYELGFNYTQRIRENHTIALSATYDPFQKIRGSYEEGQYYTSDIHNLSLYDTASGNVTTIPTYTVGVNYNLNFKGRKGSTNELNSTIGFHLSYSGSDWTKYENRYDANFANTFLNTSKYTFGIQYIPETGFLASKVKTKFLARIRYRAGTYYYTLPYETNGEQVTDFGTTFGFGIPIVIQNSLSSINLGFAIGKRGIGDDNALKERYYGINFGISIAPGTDRWFVKRKLN